MNPDKYKLSNEESVRIFEERIVPTIFDGVNESPDPKLIFTVGQPGAGKTILLGHIGRQMELSFPGQNAHVIGDDLRAYHPQYAQLLNIDDKMAAFFTDKDSASWIEQSLAYVTRLKCNTLVEGTLRRPEVTLDTARQFKDAGYRTELNLLVIPPILSRLGIFQRYFEQVRNTGVGRFTLREAHDVSVASIPHALEEVVKQGAIDELHFYRRGDVKLRSFRPTPELAEEVRIAYETLRDEPLDESTISDALHSLSLLRSLANEFHEEDMIPHLDELAEEFRQLLV